MGFGQFSSAGSRAGSIPNSSPRKRSQPEWQLVRSGRYTVETRGVVWSGEKYVAKGGTWSFSSTKIAGISDDLLNWTDVTASTTGISLGSTETMYLFGPIITNGNGTVLILGGSYSGVRGSIATSTDHGRTWAWTVNGGGGASGSFYHHGAYSPSLNRFVAISGSRISYSTDGVSWTHVSSSIGIYSANGYDYENKMWWDESANQFVLISSSSNGIFHYSSDGITWTPGSFTFNGGTPSTRTNWVRKVGSNYVIGFQNNWSLGYSSSLIGNYVSGTGFTAPSFSSGQTIVAETLGNTLVVVGTGGRYIYSQDGANWTLAPTSAIEAHQGFSVSGRFEPYSLFKDANGNGIIVSSGNNWYRSTDQGVTWTLYATLARLLDVAYSEFGSAWFLNNAGSGLYRSTDGFSWEQVTSSTTQRKSNAIVFDRTGMNGLSAAPGTAGYLWTTDGGYTWQALTPTVSFDGFPFIENDPNYYRVLVAYTGTRWLAVSSGTYCYSTTPGTANSWIRTANALPGYLHNMAASDDGKVLLQIAYSLPYVERFWSQNSGGSWSRGLGNSTLVSTWGGGTTSLRDIAWSPEYSVLVMVGGSSGSPGLFYSYDFGQTWTISGTTGISGDLWHVTWDSTNDRFIGFGGSNSAKGWIWDLSPGGPGGTTWTQLASNNSDQVYDHDTNGSVVVIAANSIKRSTDNGLTYTTILSIRMITMDYLGSNYWVAITPRNFSTGTINIHQSTNNGASWTLTKMITGMGSNELYYTGVTPAHDGSGLVVFVLLGQDNKVNVIVSNDWGTNWGDPVTIDNAYGRAVIFWNGTKFIGYTANGKKFTSTDAVTWTVVDTDPAQYWAPYTKGVEIDGSNCWAGSAPRAYSSDAGENWTVYDSGVSFNGLIWSRKLGKFLGVGGAGFSAVCSSATGADGSWTIHSILQPYVLAQDIGYDPSTDYYWVTGEDQNGQGIIMRSRDLVSWTTELLADQQNEIIATASGRERTVAVGDAGSLAVAIDDPGLEDYPSIDPNNVVVKLKFTGAGSTLPVVTDLGLGNWDSQPLALNRGSTGLSVVTGSSQGLRNQGVYLNNQAGNSRGISTLSSDSYASYHNANIAQASWTLEFDFFPVNEGTNGALIMDVGVNGVRLFKGTNPQWQLQLSFPDAAITGSLGPQVSVPLLRTGAWNHVVIAWSRTAAATGTVRVYVDGRRSAEQAYNGPAGYDFYCRGSGQVQPGVYLGVATAAADQIYYLDNLRFIQGTPFPSAGFRRPRTPFGE